MSRKKLQMAEKILVCVYYGSNGERLIQRGCKLARMLDCPLYILTIDAKPFDEMNAEKSNYIEKWRRIAEENDADDYILKDNEERPIHKVIAEVARQKGITQIIIGQSVHSRWEQISKESLVNCLLREIPFVDIHIISVARYLKDPGSNYDKGVRAYLVKENESFRLVFKHSKNVIHEGIFFKESGTDFNNGVFKFIYGKGTMHVEVKEDYVEDFIKGIDNNS
ncbi:MAG: histidine kinase [Desulfitobacteriaceae bacterium]|nr:histidine kinase [Desulfitobacteriaceae bacterium]MDD4346665.1 histidine kinase [Desulfitobacteriaceae bacterium]MDD4401734.1 histidine kinase [Desulfitobacteriaceae bacterium]